MAGLVNPDFWAGQRVLVTGHTGFKGAWLTLWLRSLGADVCGYALHPRAEPSLFSLAAAAEEITHVEGDVRDLEHLRAVAQSFRPGVVFHLAAQALVRESYRAPVETYSTNVLGTVHVLEMVRSIGGVRAVVNVTSDKCYDVQRSPGPYTESDVFGGIDPYSSSKACAELVARSYSESFFPARTHASHGVALASARAGNVIGGGDWADDRLVPDLIRAFERGRPLGIRNPGAIRPWQHVLEPLSGYLVLAERLASDPAYGEGWNFGPQDADVRTVEWIADQAARRWGPGAGWEPAQDAEQLRETVCLRLDSTKARTRLAWAPLLAIEEALDWTIEWYQSLRIARATARDLCMSQIARYESKRIALAQLPVMQRRAEAYIR